MNYEIDCEPDAIILGCPHLFPSEIKYINKFIKGKSLKRRLIIFTSREAKKQVNKEISELKSKGVEVYFDTCMVVGNLQFMGINKVVVDSAKAAYYLTAQGYKVNLLSTRDALLLAIGENSDNKR